MVGFVLFLSVCCQAFAAATSASTVSPFSTFSISTTTVPAGSPGGGTASSNILGQLVGKTDAAPGTPSPLDVAAKAEADRQSKINIVSNTRGKKFDTSGTNTGGVNSNANARRQRRPRPPQPERSGTKATTDKSSSATNGAPTVASTAKKSEPETTRSSTSGVVTVKSIAPVFEKVESSTDQSNPDDSSKADLEEINAMLQEISKLIQRKDGDADGQHLNSNRLLMKSMQDMLQQMKSGNSENDQPSVDKNSVRNPFQANTNPALNNARELLNPTQRFNNNPFNQNKQPESRPTQGSSERLGKFLSNRAKGLFKVNPDNTNKTGIKLNKELDGILYNAREPLQSNYDLLNYFNPIWRHRTVEDPQPALPGDLRWIWERPDVLQDYYQADIENVYGHRGIFEYIRHFQPKMRNYHQGRK